MTDNFTTFAVVNLKARLRPLDRGDLEDALLEHCEEQGITISLSGGGTSISDEAEALECDSEFELPNADEKTIQTMLDFYEQHLSPKGSSITLYPKNADGDYDFDIEQPKKIDFGKQEGLAIYLNGVDLPDEVYENSDINVVWEELDKAIEGIGNLHSYWQGSRETALYMYGDSFTDMKQRIELFVTTYPLCQQARIVQIA